MRDVVVGVAEVVDDHALLVGDVRLVADARGDDDDALVQDLVEVGVLAQRQGRGPGCGMQE